MFSNTKVLLYGIEWVGVYAAGFLPMTKLRSFPEAQVSFHFSLKIMQKFVVQGSFIDEGITTKSIL